jgi:hypothetical protein
VREGRNSVAPWWNQTRAWRWFLEYKFNLIRHLIIRHNFLLDQQSALWDLYFTWQWISKLLSYRLWCQILSVQNYRHLRGTRHLHPLRQRHVVPLKHLYIFTRLHDITSQKTAILVIHNIFHLCIKTLCTTIMKNVYYSKAVSLLTVKQYANMFTPFIDMAWFCAFL